MKPFKFLLFLSLFWGCNSNQSNPKTSSEKLGLDSTNDIYSVTSEDILMNSAISKAKETINEFDKALNSNNPAYSDFAIKKRYNTVDGGGEHIWISGIRIVNGNYAGFVNNDADKTTEVKYGDSVVVKKSEITDWMYLDNNILKGGYTIRVVRNRLSKEERVKMDKDLGFKIEN